ncbi:SwmB domain-containing protein, partial [Acinetobacter schindleri]|uniref:BapA/Bap/LapF family prefix-like domain-containing protein n=1 Tax=Acinetobacter schindleri TaxID=108981 RepID=UPI0032B37B5D
MASIDILAKNNGQIIQSLNADSVILNQNSVVKIGVKIEDVANILREGNAAVITLKNGEKIVVENYFDPAVNESLLVFEGDNGELYWAEFTDSSGQMLETIKYHPFQEELLSAGSLEGLLPWIGGAVAIGGIAAAASSGGGSSGSGNRYQDTTPPQLVDSQVSNGIVELNFNEPLNSTIVPSVNDFTLFVDGNEVEIERIEIVDNKIVLIPVDPIEPGQIVSIEYKDNDLTDGNGIADNSGNQLAEFEIEDVSNPDTVPPQLDSVKVNAAGNIELSFNEDVSGSDPRNDDFTVTVDGVEVPVTNIIADGNTLTLITDPEIAAGQTVEVVYNDTTPDDEQGIRDSDGYVLEGFDAAEVGGVENNSEQADPDVDPPVLIDAEVNAAGNIELSFNEDVSGSDPRNDDFTVTVDGVEVPV